MSGRTLGTDNADRNSIKSRFFKRDIFYFLGAAYCKQTDAFLLLSLELNVDTVEYAAIGPVEVVAMENMGIQKIARDNTKDELEESGTKLALGVGTEIIGGFAPFPAPDPGSPISYFHPFVFPTRHPTRDLNINFPNIVSKEDNKIRGGFGS